jgi:diguanylate cyclase (GGDEF)-like protein
MPISAPSAHRTDPLLIGAAAVLAAAGLAMPLIGYRPPSGSAEGTAHFVAAGLELVLLALVLVLYRRAPRRPLAVVACGALGLAPLGIVAGLRGDPGTGTWFDIIGHVALIVASLVYARLRVTGDEILAPAAARAYLLRALTVAVVFSPLASLVAWPLQGRPAIDLGSLGHVGLAWVVISGALAAAVVVLARPRLDVLDAALALALVTVALHVGLHVATRRGGAMPLADLLALAGGCAVAIVFVRDVLYWRGRARDLEGRLDDESRRAERHGRRLDAIWRLGALSLDDDMYLAALLDEGAQAFGDGVRFAGRIVHLEGPDLVIDLNCGIEGYPAQRPGTRYPLDGSLGGVLVREGRTASAPDMHADPRFADRRCTLESPLRCYIGTPFRVGETLYFISFQGIEPMRTFDAFDHAYVETLASLCAARLLQRAQVDRLHYHVEHDALTGTLNREALRAYGVAALRDARRVALAVVDLDHFRALNDAYGHPFGDAVLLETAGLLRAHAGNAIVGRLGSDSFAVLLLDVGDRDDVEARVARCAEPFLVPLRVGEHTNRVHVTVSIGVAIAPDDATTFEPLLAHADIAVSAAKVAGRGRWHFYDRGAEDGLITAQRMQNELAEALVRDEFVLHFQPHLDLVDGRVVGAEALIRWRHPVRGLLQPDEFLPYAEEYGMLAAIGAWVMRETVRLSRRWRTADPGFRTWFNLSAIELGDPGLLRRLTESGGDLRGVGVEITETVAMRDVDLTKRTVTGLRNAGLAIALDDFGTGYSSLAHLKQLTVDLVKIDRAFIDGLPDDLHDAAIVGAVIEIAERFGFDVLAEGVETDEQVRALRGAGCRYAQGFWFARPMEADAFDAWLRAARRRELGAARRSSVGLPAAAEG